MLCVIPILINHRVLKIGFQNADRIYIAIDKIILLKYIFYFTFCVLYFLLCLPLVHSHCLHVSLGRTY